MATRAAAASTAPRYSSTIARTDGRKALVAVAIRRARRLAHVVPAPLGKVVQHRARRPADHHQRRFDFALHRPRQNQNPPDEVGGADRQQQHLALDRLPPVLLQVVERRDARRRLRRQHRVHVDLPRVVRHIRARQPGLEAETAVQLAPVDPGVEVVPDGAGLDEGADQLALVGASPACGRESASRPTGGEGDLLHPFPAARAQVPRWLVLRRRSDTLAQIDEGLPVGDRACKRTATKRGDSDILVKTV